MMNNLVKMDRRVAVAVLIVVIVGAHMALATVVHSTDAQDEQNANSSAVALVNIDTSNNIPVIPVEIMTVGDSASITMRGQIIKENIVTVVAQSPGVVRAIWVTPGARVWAQQRLVALADTYSGGSIANINAQLTTNITQVQSEITHKNLRNLDTMRDQLNGSNSDSMSMARRDISIAKRNVRMGQLQVEATQARAAVAASAMRPATPIAGTVEQVMVRVGEVVHAGTPIAVVRGTRSSIKLYIDISPNIAQFIDRAQPFLVTVGGSAYPVMPTHIATDALGGVVVITVSLDQYNDIIARSINEEFVNVVIPLATQSAQILVPLDAVIMTDNGTGVFLNEGGVARLQMVSAGAVIGSRVVITDGLSMGMQIILDRSVIAGTKVAQKVK